MTGRLSGACRHVFRNPAIVPVARRGAGSPASREAPGTFDDRPPRAHTVRSAPKHVACFGVGCTLTTEEWQRSRNTDVRAVKPSDEVAAARLCILSESLILAQDKRWRGA